MWKPNFLKKPEQNQEDLAGQIFEKMDKYESDLLLTAQQAKEWVELYQKAEDKLGFFRDWRARLRKSQQFAFHDTPKDGEVSQVGVFIYRVMKKLGAINPEGNHKEPDKNQIDLVDGKFLFHAQNVWADMQAIDFLGKQELPRTTVESITEQWGEKLPEEVLERTSKILKVAKAAERAEALYAQVPIKIYAILDKLASNKGFNGLDKGEQYKELIKSLMIIPQSLHKHLGFGHENVYKELVAENGSVS